VSESTYVEELVGQIRALLDHILESYERLRVEAVTDFGTGVYNRRYFLRRLAEELQRGERYDSLFSLIILDFDHFKEYNDRHGHVAGDRLLRSYARIMEQSLRKPDFVARYGGDEFVVLLPGTTEPGARQVADRFLEQTSSFGEDTPTLSIGIVAYPTHGTTSQQLICTADAALYVAKQLGKNQAVSGSHEQVAAVVEKHYASPGELAWDARRLPHLGGGTPIESDQVRPGPSGAKLAQRVTPGAAPSTTVQPGSRRSLELSVKAQHKRRIITRTPNHSERISVGYSKAQERPTCFWRGTNYYHIRHLTPADITSATGLDTYYRAETSSGSFILRRRGVEWFLEARSGHKCPNPETHSA